MLVGYIREHVVILEMVFFLDASSHLYKRVCPSLRPFVRPSIRMSVCPFLVAIFMYYSPKKSRLIFYYFAKIVKIAKNVVMNFTKSLMTLGVQLGFFFL